MDHMKLTGKGWICIKYCVCISNANNITNNITTNNDVARDCKDAVRPQGQSVLKL